MYVHIHIEARVWNPDWWSAYLCFLLPVSLEDKPSNEKLHEEVLNAGRYKALYNSKTFIFTTRRMNYLKALGSTIKAKL